MTSSDLASPDLEQIQSLLDREAVRDTVYRYGSTIDSFDRAGVRSVLTDDIWARYGNDDPIVGGDEVASWIGGHDEHIFLQHHFLNVYSVDLDGDTAGALVYHTSHQFDRSEPTVAMIIVGRYRMALTRTPDGWRIARLEMEVLWADRRADTTDFLAAIGGRSPRCVINEG